MFCNAENVNIVNCCGAELHLRMTRELSKFARKYFCTVPEIVHINV